MSFIVFKYFALYKIQLCYSRGCTVGCKCQLVTVIECQAPLQRV